MHLFPILYVYVCVHPNLCNITFINVIPYFISQKPREQKNITVCYHIYLLYITSLAMLVAKSSRGSIGKTFSAHLPLLQIIIVS